VSEDRRLNYRVTPTIEREVDIHVVLGDGTVADLALIDISAGGVGMAGPLDDPPDLCEGDSIVLRFSSKRLLKPIEIPSQVRHIKPTEQGIHYGIAFDDWGGTRSHLAPKLRSLFNEREAVRVEPRPEEDVLVNILGQEQPVNIEGWLRDISVLGVGMWVTLEDQLELESGSTVQVQLTLPRTDKSLNLEALVRHQQIVGDRARIGLQIVNDQPGRWNGVHREITQYVMSRQIEIARIDAERKRAMSPANVKKTD
jgi:c-di-GMP-binding flagellar brake protein YcgR